MDQENSKSTYDPHEFVATNIVFVPTNTIQVVKNREVPEVELAIDSGERLFFQERILNDAYTQSFS